MDTSLAALIVPRLKYFKEHCSGFPGHVMTAEEWDKMLGLMLRAFELCAAHFGAVHESKEDMIREQKEIKIGLALFAKHFQELWD